MAQRKSNGGNANSGDDVTIIHEDGKITGAEINLADATKIRVALSGINETEAKTLRSAWNASVFREDPKRSRFDREIELTSDEHEGLLDRLYEGMDKAGVVGKINNVDRTYDSNNRLDGMYHHGNDVRHRMEHDAVGSKFHIGIDKINIYADSEIDRKVTFQISGMSAAEQKALQNYIKQTPDAALPLVEKVTDALQDRKLSDAESKVILADMEKLMAKAGVSVDVKAETLKVDWADTTSDTMRPPMTPLKP